MKVCFVYSNRSENSILSPFIEYFRRKASTTTIDLSTKIKNIEDNRNLSYIYSRCYNIFSSQKYDYICVLGDRRELPFVSLAAFYSNTKLVHLAAGEYIESRTTYDQYVRPIVSILSDYQICLSRGAKKEVMKLFTGISYLKPNAYNFGNPVFRGINLKKLKRPFTETYDIVLLHPQSLSRYETQQDIKQVEKHVKNKKTVFISGNKDKNFDLIEKFYQKLKSLKREYIFVDSLTKSNYFSMVRYCDNFFTNSSGISEIEYLNKHCLIEIGKRNKNRIKMDFNEKAPELLFKLMKRYKMRTKQ
ncbi:MAG: UDP-N-acetylglucosamine 2-epimerase [Nitrosotalea sp.]